MELPIPTPLQPMRTSATAVFVLALATALSACSDTDQGGVTPQLSSESDCFVSSDPNRCRLAHDKAGGVMY